MSDSPAAEQPSRLSGKKYLLTYSHQCEFHPEDLFDFLNDKKRIKQFIGVTEFHEADPEHIEEIIAPDGAWPHVHCCVWFEEKVSSTNMAWFDFMGCHPNIKAITSDQMWKDSVNYLLKEPYAVFIFPDSWKPVYTPPSSGGGNSSRVDIWAGLHNCGTNRRQWTQFCHDNKIPHAREVFMWKLEHDPKKKASTVTTRRPLIETEPTGLEAAEARRILWEDTEIPTDTPGTRLKSTVIVGPSTCGKTSWVLDWCPLPALVCRHIDTVCYFEPGYHKCIIFDDCRFAHNPIGNQIMLLDRDLVQHMHVRMWVGIIPEGTLKVFTCANYVPFVRDTQIESRMNLIWLHEGPIQYSTATSAMTDFRIV